MNKIKLLSVLVASITAGTAFADCTAPATPSEAINCAANTAKTLMSSIKSNAVNVYNLNEALGNGIYKTLNDEGHASFHLQAAKQSINYATATSKTTIPDLTNLKKALSKGDVNTAASLIPQYQIDRANLLASGSNTEFAAKDVVYLQIEEMAKAQLGKADDKNTKLKVANYAMNMYYSYYAPSMIIAMTQFSQQIAPKYVGAAISTLSQADCEAQVATVQRNIQAAQETNPSIDFLIQNGKPGSLFKMLLQAEDLNYAVDGINVLYIYATGMSATKKKTAVNICDYNAFKATAKDNMYTNIFSDSVLAASAKTGISAEKTYWALTAISAVSLDRALASQKAPIAKTGVLPY